MAQKLDSWKKRRLLIYLSLAACTFFITLAALKTTMNPVVAQTIVTQAFWVGGSVLAFYIGAATFEDWKKRDVSSS